MNKGIKYFILGIVSYIAIIPIIESLTEIICGYMEILKGKSTKEVLKINNDIADLQTQLEPQDTNCIGFQYEPQEEYEDDDWEDDKLKNKIGF